MSWRVATSLDTLLGEINNAAPSRSKISDGSIGDAAHASRSSDHNPWRPGSTVGARDFTHDPRGGLDCNDLADFLADKIRRGDHPALGSGAYIIWNWRIFSRDRASEGWRRYTGSNGHTKHLHLSVASAASGFNSAQPWGWGSPEEDDMPLNDADKQWIANAVRDGVAEELKNWKIGSGPRGRTSVGRMIGEFGADRKRRADKAKR